MTPPTTYIIARDNRVLIALACDKWTNEQLEEAMNVVE
jgi:hypothetical protein